MSKKARRYPPLAPVDWSSLPSDLVECVLQCFGAQRDRIRPTGVCKAWQLVRSSYPQRGRLWRRLRRIRVRTGMLVDNITFEYSDGSSSVHGGQGGEERAAVELGESDHLIALVCRQGDALDSVAFLVARGSQRSLTAHVYGNVGGGDVMHTRALLPSHLLQVEWDGGWTSIWGFSRSFTWSSSAVPDSAIPATAATHALLDVETVQVRTRSRSGGEGAAGAARRTQRVAAAMPPGYMYVPGSRFPAPAHQHPGGYLTEVRGVCDHKEQVVRQPTWQIDIDDESSESYSDGYSDFSDGL